MEKQASNVPSTAKEDLYDVKGEGIYPAAQDVVLGEMLEVDATPEEERKVRWKLDLVLLPMMGACYMMQYMDKYVLSQATLFNLRQDLVCFLVTCIEDWAYFVSTLSRTNSTGHRQFSTLDILSGVGQVPISWFGYPLEST